MSPQLEKLVDRAVALQLGGAVKTLQAAHRETTRDLKARVTELERQELTLQERLRALEHLVDLAVDARIPGDVVALGRQILRDLRAIGVPPAGR
jgi:hypothetical protein